MLSILNQVHTYYIKCIVAYTITLNCERFKHHYTIFKSTCIPFTIELSLSLSRSSCTTTYRELYRGRYTNRLKCQYVWQSQMSCCAFSSKKKQFSSGNMKYQRKREIDEQNVIERELEIFTKTKIDRERKLERDKGQARRNSLVVQNLLHK